MDIKSDRIKLRKEGKMRKTQKPLGSICDQELSTV